MICCVCGKKESQLLKEGYIEENEKIYCQDCYTKRPISTAQTEKVVETSSTSSNSRSFTFLDNILYFLGLERRQKK